MDAVILTVAALACVAIILAGKAAVKAALAVAALAVLVYVAVRVTPQADTFTRSITSLLHKISDMLQGVGK